MLRRVEKWIRKLTRMMMCFVSQISHGHLVNRCDVMSVAVVTVTTILRRPCCGDRKRDSEFNIAKMLVYRNNSWNTSGLSLYRLKLFTTALRDLKWVAIAIVKATLADIRMGYNPAE
ncbi:hypothetical protein GHT06_017447 [Daphnia sinensis]|uniref:Uncharacterized protein n=1 Tax=Daphnia sinensis TaxID=1820382 RepID=A0AAD5KQU8_9CRUS|nr:hypothetical protein GHT06_017447 [Daphnia sinensis]